VSHRRTRHQTRSDALQLEAVDVRGRLRNAADGVRGIFVAGQSRLDDHVAAALQVCADVFGIRSHLLFLVTFFICKLSVFDSVAALVAAGTVRAAKIFDRVGVELRQHALVDHIGRTLTREEFNVNGGSVDGTVVVAAIVDDSERVKTIRVLVRTDFGVQVVSSRRNVPAAGVDRFRAGRLVGMEYAWAFDYPLAFAADFTASTVVHEGFDVNSFTASEIQATIWWGGPRGRVSSVHGFPDVEATVVIVVFDISREFEERNTLSSRVESVFIDDFRRVVGLAFDTACIGWNCVRQFVLCPILDVVTLSESKVIRAGVSRDSRGGQESEGSRLEKHGQCLFVCCLFCVVEWIEFEIVNRREQLPRRCGFCLFKKRNTTVSKK